LYTHNIKWEKVSGDVDTICSPGDGTYQEMVNSLKNDAIKLTIKNGALEGSVRVVQQDIVPLAYTDGNMVRAIIKAVYIAEPVKMSLS
jgi:hypothetical protein